MTLRALLEANANNQTTKEPTQSTYSIKGMVQDIVAQSELYYLQSDYATSPLLQSKISTQINKFIAEHIDFIAGASAFLSPPGSRAGAETARKPNVNAFYVGSFASAPVTFADVVKQALKKVLDRQVTCTPQQEQQLRKHLENILNDIAFANEPAKTNRREKKI